MDSEGGGGLGSGADLTVPERKRARESKSEQKRVSPAGLPFWLGDSTPDGLFEV